MVDKLYIPNDYTQNCPFCRLQLVFETSEHSIEWTIELNSMKVSKIIEQNNKKTFLQKAHCPLPPCDVCLVSKRQILTFITRFVI